MTDPTAPAAAPDPDWYEGTRTVSTPYGDRDVTHAELVDLTRMGLVLAGDKPKTRTESKRGPA